MKVNSTKALLLATILTLLTFMGSADAQITKGSMPTIIPDPLVLENGDGDPTWLHEHHLIQNIGASWFNGKVGDWPGTAMLFRVVGANHQGDVIALTPRTLDSIEDQFLRSEIASVVVHRFNCDEITLQAKGPCESIAIGMTVIRSPSDNRFPEWSIPEK